MCRILCLDVSNETKKMFSDVPSCRLSHSCPLARLLLRHCPRSGFTPAAVGTRPTPIDSRSTILCPQSAMIAHSCAHPNELLTATHSPPVLPPLLFSSSSSHSSLTSRSESLWDVASSAMFTSRERRTQSSSWPSRFRSKPRRSLSQPPHPRMALLHHFPRYHPVVRFRAVSICSPPVCSCVSCVVANHRLRAHTRGRCPPAHIASITHIWH
jgi:hypothetical protein